MPDVRLVERNYHVSREVHSSNACSTEWRSSKMFGRVAVEVIVGASSSELAGLELLLFFKNATTRITEGHVAGPGDMGHLYI